MQRILAGALLRVAVLRDLSGAEFRNLSTAWVLLGVTRLAVFVVPFRWLRPWVCPGDGTDDAAADVSAAQARAAVQVGRTVARAARHTPWNSECYPQALTARILLRRRDIPHAIVFGVRRRDVMEAHAWTRVGTVVVTGGGSSDDFQPVGCFAWPGHREAGR